jgi:hypothetical protein
MHDALSTVDGPRRCHAHRRHTGNAGDEPKEPSWLLPGEIVRAQVEADAWRYLALDVPYDHRTILYGGPIGWTVSAIASAIGNRRTRRAAERLAAPQWRHLGHLPIIVTNRRLLVAYEGEWWPIWFDVIDSVDRRGDHIVLSFESDPPYGLQAAMPDELELLIRERLVDTGRDNNSQLAHAP